MENEVIPFLRGGNLLKSTHSLSRCAFLMPFIDSLAMIFNF
jgi:hypothetical protein